MKFDTYTIKSRIFPFIMLILPIIVFDTLLLATDLNTEILGKSYVVSLILLIVSIFTREKGKKIEEKLWKEWNGPPTTRFLRQNNTEYNSQTRKICYEYFNKNIPNITIPSKIEETNNIGEADDVYETCIGYLRTIARGNKKKYYLVHAENIEYGFVRNSLGLKGLGILISIIILLLIIILLYLGYANINNNLNLLIISVTSFFSLIYWIFFITKKKAKLAAENYANRLLEICFEK